MIPVIAQIVVFILLAFGYWKLCTHRQVSDLGKVVEIVSLYSVSIISILAHLKFTVWVLCIATIGVIKLLITKKQRIERGNKGLAN